VSELDEVAGELDDARHDVLSALVAASVFVDRRAAEGDPEAVRLSRLIAGALDRSTCAAIRGRTLIEEAKR
jgi:hypothetical protein